MRILDKYLYKELYSTFFAVLAVLLLITFGTEATKLLAIAVEGKIPASILFQVLLLKIPPALEIILPLVALLSVMLAMGRLYQDQEMVVLNSCGISPRYFQKRVLWFLLPLAVLTGWISLVVTPWSFQQERALISQAQATSPLAALVPGRFNQLPNSGGVFYAQSISQDSELENVWIRLNNQENDLLMIAPSGYFEVIDGRLALVLLNGRSYQGLSTGQDLVVRRFERFEGYLPEIQITPPPKHRQETESINLWQSENLREQAMLQWRIVMPMSIIVMGLIGLKMSRTGPREGRFAKVFYALVLYVVYNQFLVTLNESIGDGEWPVMVGLWLVPVVFLMFAFYQGSLKPKWLVLPNVRSLFKAREKDL